MEYDPSQPLPDSDLVTAEDLEQAIADEINANSDNQPLAETQTVEKKHRRRWSFSDNFGIVFMAEPPIAPNTEGTSQQFDISNLPEACYAYVAAFGVSVLLGRSDDVTATFATLVSGEAAKPKPKAEKKVAPNFWRQAIANTYVDITKKLPNPMTLEAATIKANGLERSVLMRLKGDPAVIRHHNKLTGATQGYSVKALLEAEEAATA